jgi:NitT/TauT family transport system ATP-binding protein/sulfonate transport system ATP-binding protein
MEDKSLIKMRLQNVSKSFHSSKGTFETLDNVTIDVYNNEFLVILGPGQCGKTVLLNTIAGLEIPTQGEIYIDNKLSSGMQGNKTNIGLIFQKTALFPWNTVIENVEFGPKLKGVSKKERRERAMYYINLVGLQGFENAYPSQLSGGMKQRVGIARAYCNDPEVLLMDEPFGQLDAQTRYQMEDEVLRIWEKEKRTVVFVTNNIEEAVYLGDRIVLLSSCPAKVKEVYSPELPRPRDYIAPGFLSLREKIANNTDLAL